MSLVSAPGEVPDPVQRATLFPRFGVEGLAWSNRIAARIRTRLADPASGAPVTEPGIAGEMLIDGPNVIDGYLDGEAPRAAVFSEDGYFRTGDLFEIAPEDPRFYRFVGRCKDIVVRGGMKISPEELDTVLAAHPKIAEVAALGFPDAVMGERVGVVAVPRAGETLALAELRDFLAAQGLAHFKWPEALALAEALPRNALGKLQRGLLRERYAERLSANAAGQRQEAVQG